jgi:hypothetical protein
MAREAPFPDAAVMEMKPNMKQRDMVRLALLMCGDRPGAKYARPTKGVHSSANLHPSRGYDR